jgi:hypothetical protein
MRLYHPKTLEIFSQRQDIPKRYITSVWSEIFKWKASKKEHPKMFIDNDYDLGSYMAIIRYYGYQRGCKLDTKKVERISDDVEGGFSQYSHIHCSLPRDKKRDLEEVTFGIEQKYFDDNYLFSDACSLYYKGINIFPNLFGDEWRKYCPVISHKEIKRQVNKTLNQT